MTSFTTIRGPRTDHPLTPQKAALVIIDDQPVHVSWPGVGTPRPPSPLIPHRSAGSCPCRSRPCDPPGRFCGTRPLLVISGERDHTVPPAVARAAYQLQKRNRRAITEFVQLPGRGHSLTVDSGWREEADTALAFIGRFV